MTGTARHDSHPDLRAGVLERRTTWSTRWETSLDPTEHRALAALLDDSYPATRFTGTRSWAGARPELRVLGRQDGGVVAHAGVIPRFLRVSGSGTADTAGESDAAVLVGDVGLVAVCPGQRGVGLGAALLREVAAALAGLALPFGFLTCDPSVRPFYERSGWIAMTDQLVRTVTIDHAVSDRRRHGMVLPVGSGLDAWPSGRVERNGQEI